LAPADRVLFCLEVWMKRMTIVLLLVLATALPGIGQTEKGAPVVNFTLQDVNGNFHSPNQHKGKVLALYLLGHD